MNEYLGTDFYFQNDLMAAPNGDAALVTGVACLAQDLLHRFMTPKGGLWCHPEYGVPIYEYIHLENTEVNRLDLIQAIQKAMEDDPRVEPGSARAEVMSWGLDQIVVRAICRPVGGEIPLSFVIGYGVSEITTQIIRG